MGKEKPRSPESDPQDPPDPTTRERVADHVTTQLPNGAYVTLYGDGRWKS